MPQLVVATTLDKMPEDSNLLKSALLSLCTRIRGPHGG